MSLNFQNPFTYFANPSKSSAIGGGLLYIGQFDADPQYFPITVNVIQPDGTEIPVSEPLTLASGGVIIYNGSPVQISFDELRVSVKIVNSANALVYYAARWSPAPSAYEISLVNSNLIIGGVPISEIGRLVKNIPIVMLEYFDENAGSGGDDTEAWTSACAASITNGAQILLADKTYHLTPNNGGTSFYSLNGLYGVGNAKIKCFGRPSNADTRFLCDMALPAGGKICNVTFDGNLSDDPAVWNSSTYNVWSGARGPRLLNSQGVTIENVKVIDAIGPGFQDVACEDIFYINYQANRIRGIFGDGINSAESKRVSRINCKVYDFTRMGFCADKTTGSACEDISNENCWAEYGHDASINYGGTEYNSCYWDEFAVRTKNIGCGGRKPGVGGRGFTLQMTKDDIPEVTPEMFNTMYQNCYIDGDNEATYGFVISSLGSTQFTAILDTCVSANCAIRYYFTGNKNIVNMRGCISIDETALVAGGAVRESILWLGGQINIFGCREYINLPSADWTLLDNNTLLCSIGAFGVDRPTDVVVSDFKSYQYDTGVEIPSRFQHGFGQTTNWTIDNCWLNFDIFVCKNANMTKSTIQRFGGMVPDEIMEISQCHLELSDEDASGQRAFEINEFNVLKIHDNTGTISGTNYLYINNNGFNNLGRIQIYNNTLKKNMDQATELKSSFIRLNEAPSSFDTTDLQWLDVSNNRFINTGASSSGPIVYSDQASFVGNLAEVRVFGGGNFKTSNITDNVTLLPNPVTATQFTVTALV